LEEAMPAIGRVQIERGTALVRVAVEKGQRAVGRGPVAREWRPQAVGIAARRLDFDDVGAEVGENPSGERAAKIRELDHANVGERPGDAHRSATSTPSAGCPRTPGPGWPCSSPARPGGAGVPHPRRSAPPRPPPRPPPPPAAARVPGSPQTAPPTAPAAAPAPAPTAAPLAVCPARPWSGVAPAALAMDSHCEMSLFAPSLPTCTYFGLA